MAVSRSDTLSSSSTSTSVQGTTPTTGMPTFSSIIRSPGSSMRTSPRNLLMIMPLMRARSSGSSSMMVPYSDANTPPRSMSPTSSTGASAASAIHMLTRSPSFRLISAGLPAPSITTASYFDSRLS